MEKLTFVTLDGSCKEFNSIDELEDFFIESKDEILKMLNSKCISCTKEDEIKYNGFVELHDKKEKAWFKVAKEMTLDELSHYIILDIGK